MVRRAAKTRVVKSCIILEWIDGPTLETVYQGKQEEPSSTLRTRELSSSRPLGGGSRACTPRA